MHERENIQNLVRKHYPDFIRFVLGGGDENNPIDDPARFFMVEAKWAFDRARNTNEALSSLDREYWHYWALLCCEQAILAAGDRNDRDRFRKNAIAAMGDIYNSWSQYSTAQEIFGSLREEVADNPFLRAQLDAKIAGVYIAAANDAFAPDVREDMLAEAVERLDFAISIYEEELRRLESSRLAQTTTSLQNTIRNSLADALHSSAVIFLTYNMYGDATTYARRAREFYEMVQDEETQKRGLARVAAVIRQIQADTS